MISLSEIQNIVNRLIGGRMQENQPVIYTANSGKQFEGVIVEIDTENALAYVSVEHGSEGGGQWCQWLPMTMLAQVS